MKKLEITQLDPEELQSTIRDIVREEINKAIKESDLGQINPSMLLNRAQICERLNISAAQFKRITPSLLLSGMFQMGGRGSEYKMTEGGLDEFIHSFAKN